MRASNVRTLERYTLKRCGRPVGIMQRGNSKLKNAQGWAGGNSKFKIENSKFLWAGGREFKIQNSKFKIRTATGVRT